MGYTGYKHLTEEESALFYEGKLDTSTFKENQYIIINDDEVYCFQEDKFRRVNFLTINNAWENEVKPKDVYQRIAIDMLEDKASTVKIIRGVYGSGKDYLMLNEALKLVEQGEYKKIVFVRPNVTVANVPQIGYLPNGIDEKLAWTLAPLYDKVGGEEGVEQLMKRGILEMVPLLFIRGRSFENSIVYVTEGQNIDTEIAKLLLGRIGEGSVMFLNGDSHQTDNRVFDKDNGVTKMVDRLAGNKLFSYCYLPITHRSITANLANLLDDEN